MNINDRKETLKSIQKGTPFATGYQLLYRGVLKPFEVWEIPLDALIYNQYNGRIGSFVKSYEKQNHTLNPELQEDIDVIERFLWDSKEAANKNTLESLKKTGQIKFGIVSSDGVIIDGNRRASLMNSIRKSSKSTQEEKDRCSYFKAVILPENASKKEILQLETSFQMGEDEKVDYNPIEKYLKCRDLEDAGFTRDEIASFMGLSKQMIDLNLEILDLMDQYLEFYDYDGLYTMAEGHEDSFQKLNIAIKQYKAGVANMWDYTEKDINDLIGVAFDYIRFDLPQNDIRDLFRKPSVKSNCIFGDKNRWKNFYENHQNIVGSFEEKSVEDYIKNATGTDITPCLKSRDEDWKKAMKKFVDNFQGAQDEVDSQMRSETPSMLIKKALSALNSIDFKTLRDNKTSISEPLKSLISLVNDIKGYLDE